MDLTRLMDDVMSSLAVEVLDSGERLVAVRLPDESAVGVRLAPTDWNRRWRVVELVVRPADGVDPHDLPIAMMLAEARRLATRSAAVVA